jgi:periplasmic nitrate reductase NapE
MPGHSCRRSGEEADMEDASLGNRRRWERGVFLFLTVVLAPVLAVLFVSAWGFTVWIWQMFNGPPGPPH